MKRSLSILAAVITVLSLCACGTTGRSLNEPVDIPDDGMIGSAVFEGLKNDNGIGIFKGSSGNINYEWTVFGSDITECTDVNLAVVAEEKDGSIIFSYKEKTPLPFAAVLSFTTGSDWDALSAAVYKDGQAVTSASVTGNKNTILNFSVTDRDGEFSIIPEQMTEEENTSEESSSDKASGNEECTKDISYSEVKDQNTGKFNTDPIPAGRPQPVEPGDITPDKNKTCTCTFSIECTAVINNIKDLKPEKLGIVPSDGIILSPRAVTFNDGESVFDVLQRVCRENNIHLESSFTPIYNSAYIEGINNLYEFDCGSTSGWMYRVNGWYPNYGSSRYKLEDGDVVELRFTCDKGKDVGQ